MVLLNCSKHEAVVNKAVQVAPSMVIEEVKKEEICSKCFVVVAGYETEFFYQEMLTRVKDAGYEPYSTQKEINGKMIRSVKIGPVTQTKGEEIIKELQEKGFPKDMFLSNR